MSPPVGNIAELARTTITRREQQSYVGLSDKDDASTRGSSNGSRLALKPSLIDPAAIAAASRPMSRYDPFRVSSHRLRVHGGETTNALPGSPSQHGGTCARLWSFERAPSLLPYQLDRDCKLGRGVAGPTNDASVVQGAGAFNPLPGDAGSMVALPMLPHGALSRSCSCIDFRRGGTPGGMPRKSVSGLQGVIGMRWDDADTPAGTCYKGGSGEGLGF
eukprot:CAMPEP_0195119346 /NCGR_PEP_ID=MMETSP0448-20130528/119224_1 /TAXON_ID=66468 /ORGANISM="Heterocapsa triquestra, Strain CCMP 448" /LENGTH=217 /DNA_ID=CAMNT_0040156671 /DNA_START=49 /DNA_END=702 /DNA_ORIENTATION=-